MDYAFIGGLIFGCALLFSPVWTILTRELGRKLVMTGGCFLMAAGFVAASFATQPWQLYLSQGAGWAQAWVRFSLPAFKSCRSGSCVEEVWRVGLRAPGVGLEVSRLLLRRMR